MSERIVLLNVDDSETSLYARSRIFRGAGFEVIEASTGKEALALIESAQPSIVILDVNLPDVNGMDVCRRIKDNADTASILVLHLTASSFHPQNKIDGLDYADGYLVEPVDPGELLATVRALLRLQRAETTAREAAQEADRRRAEAEAFAARETQARRQAEAANRAKDEFLALVSHELRTPLDAILGWTQLLQTNRSDPAMVERGLETIERNARHQTKLIGDILDASRIIAGKLSIDRRPTDLVQVVEESVEAVRSSVEERTIVVEKDLEAGPCLVLGDPNRLQQVVQNLLSNAVKFSSREGRIRVSLHRAGKKARLVVADGGQGIEPDFLPHVFERFRQAETGTSRHYGGLGIGLALVRHLVELHGGTVEASSPGPGRGSTFTVALPMMETEAAQTGLKTGPEERRVPTPSRHGTSLAGTRVLVVDDEPDARAILAAVMEQHGAAVTTAASAEEGVQAFLERRPDLIVSDLWMPGEDGYSMMRRIRALETNRTSPTPALALTAHAGFEGREGALSAGFHRHVAKPVDVNELLDAVASLLGARGES